MSWLFRSHRRPASVRNWNLEPLEQRVVLAAGDLDLSFAGDGSTTTEFEAAAWTDTRGVDAAPLAGGKVLVLTSSAPETPFATVFRLNADGTVDTTFGTAGKVELAGEQPGKIVALADGSFAVATVPTEGTLSVRKFLANGTADTSFDTDGLATLSATGAIAGLAAHPDGGFVVLCGATLYRIDAQGHLETSFGGTGRFELLPGETPGGFVIQPDGQIVASSYLFGEFAGGVRPVTIHAQRITTTGMVDATYGNAGLFSYLLTGYVASLPAAPALSQDGSIYLVGGVSGGMYSVKSTLNGQLDTSYGVGGVQVTALGGSGGQPVSFVQPDNKLVLGNYLQADGTTNPWVFVRYLPNGQLDSSFDEDGLAQVDFGGPSTKDVLLGIARLSDGSIVGVGASISSGNLHGGIVGQVRADGLPDPAFSNDGRTTLIRFATGPISVGVVDAVTTADGKTIVLGTDDRGTWVVARYNRDGMADATFGDQGRATVFVPSSASVQDTIPQSLAIGADGSVFIAGGTLGSQETNPYGIGVVVRFRPDGTLDESFGSGGILEVEAFWRINKLVLLQDGRMLAAGAQSTVNREGVIARLLSDGTLDLSFGANGLAERAGQVFGYSDLALDPDGKIVAIRAEFRSFTDNRVYVSRWFANGTLDRSFNGGVAVEFIDTIAGEAAGRVVVSPDGKILIATRAILSGETVLRRLNVDGTLDPTFELDGIRRLDMDAGSSVDIALLPDNKIAVLSVGGTATMAVVLKADGNDDPTWLGGGRRQFAGTRAALTTLADSRLVVARTDAPGGVPTRFKVSRLESFVGIIAGTNQTLTTTEEGVAVTFDVRLSSRPTASVTIPVMSSDTSEGTVNVTSLTFTPENWSTPQVVTITGVDDDLFDTDQRYRIVFGAATSTDTDYNGLTGSPVEVRNRDDETLRFFRTYNPQANFHFFTSSVSEFEGVQPNGYNDESTGRGGFSLSATEQTGFTPLFRLYNLQQGFHYYTASVGERDALLALNPPEDDPSFGKVGWRFEGSPGFIAETEQPGTSVVYRLYNAASGTHLFTENPAVKDAVLQLPGWQEHDPLGFAYLVDDAAPVPMMSLPAFAAASTTPVEQATTSANVASLVALPAAAKGRVTEQPEEGETAATVPVTKAEAPEADALDAWLGSLDWDRLDSAL